MPKGLPLGTVASGEEESGVLWEGDAEELHQGMDGVWGSWGWAEGLGVRGYFEGFGELCVYLFFLPTCVSWMTDDSMCVFIVGGGCPIDLLSSESRAGLGVDCTTLPGVADVSCIAGGCAVHKCLKGYKVSRSGQHCEVVGKMIDTVVEIIAEVAEENDVEPEFVQGMEGTKASEVEVSEVSEVKAHGVWGGYVEEATRIVKVVKAFGMDYVFYRK